ncbi:3-hydroxyacyl-CoA dehydrogenase family protein [Acuticoccus mangrovi]|uniref:NAD(P)-binding domain-containing protein n=1 Tax=Acuticoccus mangrovi TaxID=2796142 RepID=A0A934MNU6_9HYPH|nr:3-hydroxyacyl-CoA dehydrogenase NAD-binding domain-containing protein [Acuticoccus mangrovi]MBJ3778514.1 NAD(P)-binding domain-containing protein [Acuticoccus mangrovi]
MTMGSPADARQTVAIVGAGAMGAGIAIACARAGHPVRCFVRSDESRSKLFERIGTALDVLVSADLAQPSEKDGIVERIRTAPSIGEAVEGSALIVESVPEAVPLKLEILAAISDSCEESAVITTNTSSLDLAELEGAVAGPARFAGLHWFYPAELVEVVEIVAAPSTAPAVLDALQAFAEGIAKQVVRVKRPIPGFVVNRLQYALLREAHHLMAEGVCDAQDIDASLVACLGPRWSATGPLESMDLAGLDVHLAVAQQLYPQLSAATEPHPRLVELVAKGDLGAKSGRGICGGYDSVSVTKLFQRRAAAIRALRRAERT